MKRVEVKNGVISFAAHDPPHYMGKPPKLRGERQGTIMVYRVDRTKLDPKTPRED